MQRIRKPGEFCWINVMTPETGKAREFFGSLLGWTFTEMPGMGHGIKVGESNVGGLFDVVSPQTPNGMQPLIGVMVKVESADATAAKVKALGGTAMPAFDIGGAGRMAVCHDPVGGAFDIWESRSMQGTDVDMSVHGAPSWFETLTLDAEKATSFYSALFDWTSDVKPMRGHEYTTFQLAGNPVAGLMRITPETGATKSHWGTYVSVADVDATARDAAALGATPCVPPRDIDGIGRFCGVISPQGVTFYAITYSV